MAVYGGPLLNPRVTDVHIDLLPGIPSSEDDVSLAAPTGII